MLLTGLYFLLALFILVIIHEYGHFQVARCCGVKVLRFSFGFGKSLFSWQDKKGTEYSWALFPLGGYVKMLDENEEEVPESQRHLAFNRKSPWAKMAIVAAGPMANFLLAFILLWLVAIIGVQSLAPMIAEVKPESIAGKAGLAAKEEIIALNTIPIRSWRDFQYAMMPYIGSDKSITLQVKNLKDGQEKQIELALSSWSLNPKKPDLLASLGIKPFIPAIPPLVAEVKKDWPGEKAGILKNDRIVAVDGKPLNDWLELVDYVKKRPNILINLSIERGGQQQQLHLIPGERKQDGKVEGFAGLVAKPVEWPANWLRTEQETLFAGLSVALGQTLQLIGNTFTLTARLATGKISLQSISGPIGIAQGAGDSARSGIVPYLFFLALMSISIGVLNLLPIPLLDGGHLLYYALEIISGRPLPELLKTAGVYIGMLFLGALMLIAFGNDISRLILH